MEYINDLIEARIFQKDIKDIIIDSYDVSIYEVLDEVIPWIKDAIQKDLI